MPHRETIAVVLAAGKGTRMKSDLPKVLVPACGRPMVEYVLDALDAAGVDRVLLVVGYRADLVRETLAHRTNVEFVEQREQLGTGHAVMVCRPLIKDFEGDVLVLTGDSPMMQGGTLRKMIEYFNGAELSCLLGSIHRDDPYGLGRILRNEARQFVGIVEEKDATDAQRKITEVNLSYYLFRCPDLSPCLDRSKLSDDNAQKEYYITDVPAVLYQQGKPVDAIPVLEPCEALGVNTMDELRAVEAAMKKASGK